jgi:1,4-dihydroxy-2-naphthoate octaprenyltransferase
VSTGADAERGEDRQAISRNALRTGLGLMVLAATLSGVSWLVAGGTLALGLPLVPLGVLLLVSGWGIRNGWPMWWIGLGAVAALASVMRWILNLL